MDNQVSDVGAGRGGGTCAAGRGRRRYSAGRGGIRTAAGAGGRGGRIMHGRPWRDKWDKDGRPREDDTRGARTSASAAAEGCARPSAAGEGTRLAAEAFERLPARRG